MQFSMYSFQCLHTEKRVSYQYFKSSLSSNLSFSSSKLFRKSFIRASLRRWLILNNKYLLIFKTSYTNESFSFWTFRKVNFSVVNGFDLGLASVFEIMSSWGNQRFPRRHGKVSQTSKVHHFCRFRHTPWLRSKISAKNKFCTKFSSLAP